MCMVETSWYSGERDPAENTKIQGSSTHTEIVRLKIGLNKKSALVIRNKKTISLIFFRSFRFTDT